MIPYLFILNGTKPISFQKKLQNLIERHFSASDFETKTTYSLQAAIKYIKENKDKYETVVSIGGDGTIFSTVQFLAQTKVNLGIIPAGSGNGLARGLGIPLDIEQAFLHLKKSSIRSISLGKMDNLWFTNVAGIGGFDALVCRDFENQKIRKIWGYTKIVAQHLFRFKKTKISVQFSNGDTKMIEPFMFTIANGVQFGYNFYIAPKQRLDGTKFHLMILDSIPWYKIAYYLLYFTRKKSHSTPRLNRTEDIKLTVSLKKGDLYQLDGEGFRIDRNKDVSITRVPNALNLKG